MGLGAKVQGWLDRRVAGAADRKAECELRDRLGAARIELQRRGESAGLPKIVLVKQDVCEDLYCCAPGASARQIVESTMLRSGPVALFSRLGADFIMVQTESDPECEIWKERAIDLKWESLEFFAGYRDRIPGRDYGQNRYSVPATDVDWSRFDIVISVDVAVPQRVTRRFPGTCWCYYVREVKAPSYGRSLQAPAAGQDLCLNHCFRLRRPVDLAPHVVEFPYHLQYYGCFHELFAVDPSGDREGVFVDHHTMVRLPGQDADRLGDFGPVTSPVNDPGTTAVRGHALPHRRTMDSDLRDRLLHSKYFLITPGQRNVFGTAMVEAIAAGCLAIGSPRAIQTHGFFFTRHTAADDGAEAIRVIRRLEANPARYRAELERQRMLVDQLCFVRPTLDLLDKSSDVLEAKNAGSEVAHSLCH